jgi:ubiquinone/menaquinone biosynthesis C-methylase UbiE
MRNIESEHERYLHQARWTEDLRSYIFGKIKAAQKSRVLEVGSGTGAILGQLDSEFSNFAMDIEHQALRYSRDRFLHVKHIQGDGHSLPYPSGTFQICTCHFLLLWVDNAERILAEMKRVTRPGGWVIAFAEPDYGE